MRLEASSPRAAWSGTMTTPVPQTDRAPELVGKSDAFTYMQFRLDQVAPTNATVLLLGETGTGKGLAAQAIHRLSSRHDARFVTVDCTALPPTLLESELFGRERGAFTDARTSQIGRFEMANGGTVFLDEVGELPPEAQAKLLRVLQEGAFERLGSPRTIHVDVRIIAATNRCLADDVRHGRFRSDLYFRLSVFPITMPPLRERTGDLPLLVKHFVQRLAARHHKRIDVIPPNLVERLEAYDWPGNVRELENVLERAIITSPNDGPLRILEPLGVDHVDLLPGAPTTALIDVERAHILRVLGAKGWRIEGSRGAAVTLGLKPSTLRTRMRKLGITRMGTIGKASGAAAAC